MNLITEINMIAYVTYLKAEERAAATVEKYTHDVQAFTIWANDTNITKEIAVEYKQHISKTHKSASVNAAIAALNAFFTFMGWDIKLKPLKIQRQTFKSEEKELTRTEYERLLAATQAKGDERMNMIIQTICSTGIRVSELCYITIEAAQSGQAIITNKGKTRTVFLPQKLKTALLRYAKERGIISGCLFITRTGKPINRRDIWSGMKSLCEAANVEPSKVFPHNLRHLFAREFYRKHKDVVRLADILGHSNVNTTRIYTMESGAEHRKLIDNLELAVRL